MGKKNIDIDKVIKKPLEQLDSQLNDLMLSALMVVMAAFKLPVYLKNKREIWKWELDFKKK